MGIGQDASDEGLTVTRVSADGVQGETFDYVRGSRVATRNVGVDQVSLRTVPVADDPVEAPLANGDDIRA